MHRIHREDVEGQETMAIEITKEQQRMIDLAIASGAFRSPDDVIGTALAMLFEEIEDGIVSEVRRDDRASLSTRWRRNSERSAR
jgi:Arc/MetJ-type ribon-helix-helix transcriptional regulator